MDRNYNNENNYENEDKHIIPEVSYKMEDAEPEQKKHLKKDFFKTMAKGAAYAAIFGLVAGTSFSGLQYVSSAFQTQAEKQDSKEDAKDTEDAKEQLSLTETDTSSQNTIIKTGNTTMTDVSSIAELVMPSIVAIDCEIVQTNTTFFGQPVQSEGTGSGTGIIIKQDKDYLYIASNNHVVADSKTIEITFHDGKKANAIIKGTDASVDLAVIAVKLSDLSADTKSAIKIATLGNSTTLKVGEMSVAIGNALGYGQSVTVGYISAVSREVEMDNGTMTLIQTDAAINPGNSGGALVNMNGEVIGINSAKFASDEIEGMGFAIPVSDAIPILEDLMNREEIDEADQGYLGITGVSVEEDYQELYHMPAGVFIDSVDENSPAAKAGLKEGYIITKIKGRSVSAVSDIQNIMTYTKGGTTVEITYETQTDGTYTEKTTQVTLGKKSDSASYIESKKQEKNDASGQDETKKNDQDNDFRGNGNNRIPYGYGSYGNGGSDYESGFPYGYLN